MSDYLSFLFYQAIVAVNTAVILNAIIWLAKRKEKREKGTNPDFTPPSERLGDTIIKVSKGNKYAHRWYGKHDNVAPYITVQGEPYKLFGTFDSPDGSGKIAEYDLIKPPTAESVAEKPKGYILTMVTKGAAEFGETHEFDGEEYERTMVAQSADGETVTMTYRRKQSPKKDGASADEAAKLFSKLSQAAAGLGGNSKLDELEEKLKALADTLDRTDEKPVTPERLKEAGIEMEYLNAKCGDCKNWKRDSQIFGHCTLRRCPVKEYERRQCQFFEKWYAPQSKPAFATLETQPFPKEFSEGTICGNCRWFVKDNGGKFGVCVRNDEITGTLGRKECFERKQTPNGMCCENCAYLSTLGGDNICAHTGLHVYAIGTRMYCDHFRSRTRTDKPKPLGTKTTH